MLVTDFMTPADKVVKCNKSDPVNRVLELMINNKVSAVVIMDAEPEEKEKELQHNGTKPIGILTKTDLVVAYQQGVALDQKAGLIMKSPLKTIRDNQGRDQAASALEHLEFHHAVVVNQAGDFVGLVSAWDIAAECARDARAWPWNRTPNGRIEAPPTADVH